MTFLLRRFDPGFNNPNPNNTRSDEPPMKFEEEVSLAFRTLGYPFPISKTGIVAVGSPHTWPALIAAIDWLIDMLVVVEMESPLDWMEEEEEEPLEEEACRIAATRQFDKFVREALVAFYRDDAAKRNELEIELLERWDRVDKALERRMEQIHGENEEVKGEIEVIRGECDG
jgi:kinetochore protein NDC80